jgi:hypothetical protein
MDFKKLTDRAKDLVEKRGGTDSLKEDATELKGIANGEGSLADKAKAAAAALKDPGSDGDAPGSMASAPEPPTAPEPAAESADDRQGPGRRGRGRRGGGRGRRQAR